MILNFPTAYEVKLPMSRQKITHTSHRTHTQIPEKHITFAIQTFQNRLPVMIFLGENNWKLKVLKYE